MVQVIDGVAVNPSQQLPRKGNAQLTPRFKVERQMIAGQFDENTGLPKVRTQEIIELSIPGDQKSTVARRLTPELIRLYKKEYDEWKSSKEQPEGDGGLPLRHWPQLPPEIAEGLKYANVFTVTQLAGLSDSQCQIRGALGIRKYRDMAKAFVDASAAAAPIAKLETENEAQANRISLLEANMADMQQKYEARIAELEGEVGATPDLSQRKGKRQNG